MKGALKGTEVVDFTPPGFIGGTEALPIPNPVATIAPSAAAAWCQSADLTGVNKDLSEFCEKALKKYLSPTPKP
jgi:hypothetical protein